MRRVKSWVAATVLSGGLALGVGVPAALSSPAGAQPVFTGGLVNITVSNVLNNNNVQVAAVVPIEVAATICDVDVTLLSQQLASGNGSTTCETRGGNQTVQVTQIPA